MPTDTPMRLVPVDLTDEMRGAAINVGLPGIGEPPLYEKMWRAMLASAPPVGEEVVERWARILCETDGQDPDEIAPTSLYCGPNNEPCPMWMAYTEGPRAILSAIEGET